MLVDDEEFTDVDILDITDPRNPVLVNDTLDLDEPPFDVDQASPREPHVDLLATTWSSRGSASAT